MPLLSLPYHPVPLLRLLMPTRLSLIQVLPAMCKPDVIQRVATAETTAHGTVEVDVYGTVEQCTGKSQSCSTYAHNLNRLVEVVVNDKH